eukprot:CAMPEP_0118633298 /NCGR_PEP_ID=MMETSP0785-20121206/918_1 /TAXON_ID=91992 /ORGANISM="Bolidomonas pacifica, Strain CCMP 1866" /LENGTH=400 /DNA_ID=CAMNT_0006524155 /DNA_START=170 /DNA_END=1370 /DNA_ORIENTATION=-
MASEFIRSLVTVSLSQQLAPLEPAVESFINTTDTSSLYITVINDELVAKSQFTPSPTVTLVFFKHGAPAKVSSVSQIGFLSIPPSSSDDDSSDSPLFSTLQSLNQNTFVPSISSLYSTSSSADDNLSNFTNTMRDLNSVIDHLKRAANVPTVNLLPHPTIISLLSASAPSLDPTAPLDSPLDVNTFDASSILSSDETLNSIQSTVNVWIKDITKLTSLTTTTPFPNDANEVPIHSATISVLKQAKRFVTTTALENNTHLPTALEYTADVNSFLQNFPIKALLSSTDLPSLTKANVQMFQHYPKVRNSKNYDLYRLAKLLESTTEALRDQIITILKSQNVMTTPIAAFQSLDSELTNLFSTWDADYKKFTTFFLEQYKRRGRLTTSTSPNAPTTTPLQLLK